MNLPILSSIILLPIFGVILILLISGRKEKEIKFVSLSITCAVFLLTLFVVTNFDYRKSVLTDSKSVLTDSKSVLTDSNTSMQFVERYTWIKNVGIEYHLGVDGISLPLLFLGSLLGLLVVVFSWNLAYRVKAFFILLLLLETGALGLFLALDFILFYIFWEWVLVPMYFLISIWGGPRKEYAALKFLLYTLFGSVIMLIGILGMYFSARLNTFSILDIARCKFPLNLQALFFLALFIGFAFKVPLFPFHTWLPDAYTEAPIAGSVFLAGILAKMGTYGFIRIVLPILPDALRLFATPLAILGIVNIVYGAIVAMAQKDLKRLIAYSSLSHMGYIILGIAAGTVSGLNGAVLGMFNHGIIIGLLFLSSSVISERRQTWEIKELEGTSFWLPSLSGILTFAALTALGLPGLSNFINEFMVLLGVFQSTWLSKILIILVIPGMILTIIYFLRLIIRINLLQLGQGNYKGPGGLTLREWIVFIPLMVIVLILGLYPAPILNFINPAVT
ncbi:MAG TPA: oxidoreductase, partial [Elusimicrobia bacterium]|nr:oxidoreductase [Elusimicrobiota bacterium]